MFSKKNKDTVKGVKNSYFFAAWDEWKIMAYFRRTAGFHGFGDRGIS